MEIPVKSPITQLWGNSRTMHHTMITSSWHYEFMLLCSLMLTSMLQCILFIAV